MAEDEDNGSRANELFLESILENLPNMVFVKEAEELRFVRLNRAGEDLLGFTRDELLGKNDFDFFPADQAEFFAAKDREVLARGELLDIPEEPVETRANGRRWLHTRKIPIVDGGGIPRYLLGISADITEAKEARDALTAQSEQLGKANRKLEKTRDELKAREWQMRVLLDRFPGAVWTVDKHLRIRSASGGRAKALGMASDVEGAQVEDLLGEETAAACSTALDGEPASFELFRDGRSYEIIVEPLRRGEHPRAIGVAVDVTEAHKLRTERLQSQLQQAQKLEVLGILAGGIAHDFNNLLTSMLGHSSLALADIPEGHAARNSLRQVQSSAERASELTRQLLAYSGRGAFVVKPVVLNEAIDEITALLAVGIGKDVRLEFDFQPELPPVEADVAQLRQVLMNLLTNANDAIGSAGGVIRLTTKAVDADRELLASAYLDEDLPPGRYVCLEVQDTGEGMSAAVQHRMFDPFFTTKDAGHGLGLAATLGIIRGHHGTIRVDSKPGAGTTIQVLLPTTGPAPTNADAGATTAALVPEITRTVLVVDDEETVRGFARACLERQGLQVLEASDGLEALQKFRAWRHDIDAVLLDLTMPRLGGREALRQLRGMSPDLPILLSSGYVSEEMALEGVDDPNIDFLAKPYRTDQLLHRIGRLLLLSTQPD